MPSSDKWLCRDRNDVPIITHTKFSVTMMVLGVMSNEGVVMLPEFIPQILRTYAANCEERFVRNWIESVNKGIAYHLRLCPVS